VKNLYPARDRPSHEENVTLSRKALAGDKRAREAMINRNAGLAYHGAIRYAHMNKARGNIDDDDLLQAALVGLINAVDNYNPDSGYKFSSYATFWINKRLSEEVIKQHWSTVKPPYEVCRRYLYRHMNDKEQDGYATTFMFHDQIADHEARSIATDDHTHLAIDILRACRRANLTKLEELVFQMMHSPDSPCAKREHVAVELSITRAQVDALEKSALEKIRVVLGVK
jgi:RNA polymerase sigma factor (sigma-70 family)